MMVLSAERGSAQPRPPYLGRRRCWGPGGRSCAEPSRVLRVVSLSTLLTLSMAQAVLAAGDFAHSPEYIARVNSEAFKGEKPAEIARYLAHFSGGVAGGAVRALVEGGKENLPLVRRLLKDSNPWIRGGAVRVLAGFYGMPKGAKGAKVPEREVTPELREAMDLVSSMLDDPHPEVQSAVGHFFRQMRMENAVVHKVLLAQAADMDPSVRGSTVSAVRHWIKDPETRLRVGMAALNRPDGINPHALSLASSYVLEQKEIAHDALPVMVRYLNEKAHLMRGFFTNGPYQRGLRLIDHYYDPDLEEMPGVVKAVCRSIIRIPWSTYGGWMDARKVAVGIMEKMTPAAAPPERAAPAHAQEWIDASTDDELRAVTPVERVTGTPREKATERVKYLLAMADWLAAGKPADAKPELKHPEPKKKRKK